MKKKKIILLIGLLIVFLIILLYFNTSYEKGASVESWGRNRTINWEWDLRNLWPF